MTDINSVTMTGNLTKDVEIRNNVAKLSIAVSRSVKDQNGNWTDVASYFDWIRFLGQNADVNKLQQKLVKGTPVTLMGEARQNKWQDQQGNNCYSINFVVGNMKIHARPTPAAAPDQSNYVTYNDNGYARRHDAPQAIPTPVNHAPENFDDSDIPF